MDTKQKNFYSKMWYFALPITVQLLITSGLNMVDSLMVGGLGVEAIASVGIANKYSQFLIFILQGFASGATIFCAQYWGRKDLTGVRRTLMLVMKFVTIFALLFSLFTIFYTKGVLSIFTKDEVVIREASTYLRIISLSYLFTGWSMIFNVTLKTMNIIHKPTIFSIITLLLNTLFNWILIYGPFGLPSYGIAGAAVATLLARLVQTLLLLYLLYENRLIGKAAPEVKPEVNFPARYFKLTLPSIFNHFTWTMGDLTLFWIYTQVGTRATAAVSLVDPLVFIFISAYTGLSDASSVMIGQALGKGSFVKAKDYARRFLRLTLQLSAVTSILIVLFTPVLLSLYNITTEVEDLAKELLIVFAILSVFKHYNYINNVGILRVGGDTTFVMWLDTLFVWAYSIPLAFFLQRSGVAFPILYFAATSHDILRAIIGHRRTASGKWVRSLVSDAQIGDLEEEA
ncbi:MAG TPA: MATE family efflux transporter [Proteiniclasticum sp.]|nr:MATE family efflux transporter [Proteiniclasticum sp.]